MSAARPRVAIAGFQHETNTFAPMPTPFEEFARGGAWPGLTRGADVLEVFGGLNIPIGGFIGAGEAFEIIPILWAGAEPSSYVTDDAFDRIAGMIVDGVLAAGSVDAVYLDLHGAMVTESHEDGEGELLRRLRDALGPDLPIAVSLDLHGNLTPAFARHATCATIYRTYPHYDMAETGGRAARLLQQVLAAGGQVAKAHRQLDYIAPITAQSTMREPGGRLYGLLPGLEGPGVLSIDFAFGFPPADIHDCGISVLAYGTDQDAVDRAADAMRDALADAEPAFRNPLVGAAEAVDRAKAQPSAPRPVVLCDPQDNPGAGAVGDSTGLLHALVDQGAEKAALSMLWGPEAAAQAHAVGEGGEFQASLGGRYPEIGGPPLEARVRVEALSDGMITFTGPMYGGATARLGKVAALRVLDRDCDVVVVVGEIRCQNADQEMFRAAGIEPADMGIVAVKSSVHFLADYEPIAQEVIFVEAPGANPCQLDRIPYTRLRPGVRLGPCGPAFQPSARS